MVTEQKSESSYPGHFSSAAMRFATGAQQSEARKDGIEVTKSDSDILEIKFAGSNIKVDTRQNLISINGGPTKKMQGVPESDRDVFNRFANGAEIFGVEEKSADVKIHRHFGSTVIDFGSGQILMSKTSPSTYGIAVSQNGQLYGEEFELLKPAPYAKPEDLAYTA